MKIAFFSAQPYDRRFFDQALQRDFADAGLEFTYLAPTLSADTVALAQGFEAICVFVNDQLDAGVLATLKGYGVSAILLRCAGFNNVDLDAAKRLDLFVARVPGYSPEAVAEHTLALVMTLNRHTHRAYNRVREGNFMLDGLLGFNLHGKTVGIIGTGQIGLATARIFKGFGCRATDPRVRPVPDRGLQGTGRVRDAGATAARGGHRQPALPAGRQPPPPDPPRNPGADETWRHAGQHLARCLFHAPQAFSSCERLLGKWSIQIPFATL